MPVAALPFFHLLAMAHRASLVEAIGIDALGTSAAEYAAPRLDVSGSLEGTFAKAEKGPTWWTFTRATDGRVRVVADGEHKGDFEIRYFDNRKHHGLRVLPMRNAGISYVYGEHCFFHVKGDLIADLQQAGVIQ